VRDFHPRLYDLLELRKELGVRSITNVAARLAVRAPRHFIAISHAPYFAKYREALRELGEEGLVVMGSEGETEAPYHGVVKSESATWRPEEFGLPRPRIEQIPAATVAEEAALSRRVLDGEPLPHRTVVVMTAAAALVAATGVAFCDAVARVLRPR
jgi:anthranilate phosphoribosyltransferase